VPAFTVSVCGPKLKLSIATMLVGPSAQANSTLAARSEPTAAPSTVEVITGRNIAVLLSFEAAVDDRLRLPRARLDQCRNYSGFHDLLINISFGVIAAHGTRQIHIIPANRR
jgi:hypothetical protein